MIKLLFGFAVVLH